MDIVILVNCVIKGDIYKGIIGKWLCHGHVLANNSFVKFHGKKCGSHMSVRVLYRGYYTSDDFI